MTHLPSPADFSFAGVVGRLRSHVNALEDTANLTDPYAECDQRTEDRTFRCYGCDEPRETEVAHCDCCGEQTTSWVNDGSFPVLPLVTRKAVSLNPDAWRA